MYFEIVGVVEAVESIATDSRGAWDRQKTDEDQEVSGLSAMADPSHFVVCIRNEGCEDLQLRKLYRVLPNEAAARSHFLRVIDDSGEDYLYRDGNFLAVDLPASVEDALAALASA